MKKKVMRRNNENINNSNINENNNSSIYVK